MVVAADDEHAALFRGAVDVAVLERVAGAVHAGALAVPHRENAIDGALRIQRHALHAQAGGGGEVLVDRGQEVHLRLVEELLRLPQLAAAIAADEAGGLQALTLVLGFLGQQQPHEGLRPGEEHLAGLRGEVVRQLVGAQGRRSGKTGFGHGLSPQREEPAGRTGRLECMNEEILS